MNKQQAITWYNRVPQGTYKERMEYLEKFGAGSIAKVYWSDPLFTLGIEYGIMIALTKAFDITKEDLKG